MLTLSRESAIILVAHSPTARSGASPISCDAASASHPARHRRLQAGGSAGRSDGNAALHLARVFARRDRRCSKLVGFFVTVAGALIGGVVTARSGAAVTATQYALPSSLASVGRTLVASSGGVLAEKLGWVRFFLLTTVGDRASPRPAHLDRSARQSQG